MTSEIVVESFHPSKHANGAVEALYDSFFDDPVIRHFVPDDEVMKRLFRSQCSWTIWIFWKSFGMTDVAVTTDDKGKSRVANCAVWHPAEENCMFYMRMLLQMVAMLPWTYHTIVPGFKYAMKAEKERQEIAPDAMHLHMIGTHADFRGKGVGSKAIKAGLDRADAEGMQCYLESSNPRNVPFYERHGFKVVKTIHVTDDETSPVVSLMLRDAVKVEVEI